MQKVTNKQSATKKVILRTIKLFLLGVVLQGWFLFVVHAVFSSFIQQTREAKGEKENGVKQTKKDQGKKQGNVIIRGKKKILSVVLPTDRFPLGTSGS